MLTTVQKIKYIFLVISSMILWLITLFWLSMSANIFLISPSFRVFILIIVFMFAAWQSISIACDKIIVLQVDRTLTRLNRVTKESDQEDK